MFRIRDPLGLAQQDPELRAKIRFHKKVLVPVCLAIIAGSLLIIVVVVLIEVIKHGHG